MTKALKIKNLEKKYKDVQALKKINLEIRDWDFFALLWINWAGKTTIIWIITDLVNKTSGSVKIFGTDIDDDFAKAKTMIWVVPQEFNMDIFWKVIDVITIQAGYYGISKQQALINAEKYLKVLGLWEKRNARIMELSGGMKRRVMIARALAHDPKLLILDEPTAWVDINLRKSTYEFLLDLNKAGTTILLTTHYLEEVDKLCNAFAVIDKWEIIINTTKKEFLKDKKWSLSAELEDVFENLTH